MVEALDLVVLLLDGFEGLLVLGLELFLLEVGDLEVLGEDEILLLLIRHCCWVE